MNLEVERYEGELRVLRTRVKELEKEVSYMQNELRTVKPTWEQKSIDFHLPHYDYNCHHANVYLSFQELSRKELRPLRRKLTSSRELKRCGKRIQLHCDPDGNASITQQEWLACVLKHSGVSLFSLYM